MRETIRRLFHREAQPAPERAIIQSEPRWGENGYGVYVDGKRVAWGRSQTAAIASYECSRAA